MKKKDVFVVFLGYAIWGVQPLYWALLAHMDSLFVMCGRVVWALVFALGVLALTKRLPELKALFKDKARMKYLAPATVFMAVDWTLFIVAVQTGHVMDTSLGYYLSPFVAFAFSVVIFKEKPNKLMLIAMVLAMLGVLVSVVGYGSVPVIAIVLMFATNIYAMLKRFAKVEPVVSIAAETAMMLPFSMLFVAFFRMGANGMAALRLIDIFLLVGSGILTAVPMMLYAVGVLKLPFFMLGFMQYVSPTLSLICALFMGEKFTPEKVLMFAFIWAGMALYTYAIVKQERKKAELQQAELRQAELQQAEQT